MDSQAPPAGVAPGSPSATPTSTHWVEGWLLLLVAVCVLLLLAALGRIDASIGRIEVPGYQAYSLSSVGQPLKPSKSKEEAGQAWCLWHYFSRDAAGPDPLQGIKDCQAAPSVQDAWRKAKDHPAEQLIHWFVRLDMVMVVLYLLLAWRLVLRLRRGLCPNSDLPLEQGLWAATGRWGLGLLLAGLFASEMAEAFAQWRLGEPGRLLPTDAVGSTLAFATPLKWALTATVAVLLLLLLIQRWIDVTDHQIRLNPKLGKRFLTWWRAVGMLRVQLLVVGGLTVLLTGVGADQVPDALLRWGDVWGDRLGGLAGVIVLSLLVWRSAHRTALTKDRELKPLWPLAILLVGAVLLGQIKFGLRWANLAGLGVVLLVVAALSWLVGVCPLRWNEPHTEHEKGEEGEGQEGASGERTIAGIKQAIATAKERAGAPPKDVREHVRHLARWLAAVPLAALGVGLVRAAAAPALLREPQAKPWLAYLGAGLALLAALVPLLLELGERWINLAVYDKHTDRFHYGGSHRLYWVLFALSLLVYGLAV
jgi:hypothetical protein